MIPRDGGNTFSGSIFTGFQNQSFQGNNITSSLIARGVKTADGIGKLWNTEGSLGGPISKDKVWFFGSARNFILDTLPANTFYGQAGTGSAFVAPTPTTEKGVDPQSIRSVQARITWQLSQKNKLAVYNDRLLKNRGSAMTAGFDPLRDEGEDYADKLRDFFAESPGAALLMRGTEGEAFANPKRRPQIEFFSSSASEVLFEAEHGSIKSLPALPDECDARTTANWIRETLDGEHPIPLPLINQLACCLYATGYSEDFSQAKAVAAVKARLPLAA